jgi:flagellum-specific peptidoglycan hydrolase FlgJ
MIRDYAQGETIDLTKAMQAGRFYKAKPKRLGLWATLLVTNTFWVCFVFGLGGLLWTATEMSSFSAEKYLEERQHLARIKAAKEEELRERDMKIARLLAFQSSGPGDIVNLANTIHSIFKTARHSEKQTEFLEKAMPEAIRLQMEEGIPASAVLAQSIYESYYGQSNLSRQAHNYFGLKAYNWSGKRINMPTKDSGVLTRADFRAYDTMEEGFEGYIQFLRDSNRYTKAFGTKTGVDFIRELLRGGYCPDSDYLTRIREIMSRHNLDRLDSYREELTASTEEEVRLGRKS